LGTRGETCCHDPLPARERVFLDVRRDTAWVTKVLFASREPD
jgi:hypothetical protein